LKIRYAANVKNYCRPAITSQQNTIHPVFKEVAKNVFGNTIGLEHNPKRTPT